MTITKIKIKLIVEKNGHLGFTSVVIDDWLFLNNIAIFRRLNEPDKIRLVFPEKKVEGRAIKIFYPLQKEMYFKLEEAVASKL